MKRKKMVHVNKLRKTIGRLEVKVARRAHSHLPPGPCWGSGRARSGGEENPILRTEGFCSTNTHCSLWVTRPG